MLFVGDIHGEFSNFKKRIFKDKEYIQLGDMGLGFDKNIDKLYPIDYKIKFIRGNHDNPEVCKRHPHYLGDFGMYKGIFYISGAASIDRQYRIEGVSWWPDEELNYLQQKECMNLYLKERPDIIITHDCPLKVCKEIYTHEFKNVTGAFFDRLFEEHNPKKWIFAHHHKSFEINVGITKFICLDTMEIRDEI